MADEKKIETDGGASVGGDANTGGGDFVGRDKKNENSTEVNINIPMPTWNNPPVAPDPKLERRQLPLELEREFRQSFEKLTTALIELKATVTVNNTLTESQIELLRSQVDAVAELVKKARETGDKGLPGLNVYVPDKAPPRWIWPMFTVFGALALLLLAVIAWRLTMGGA